MIIKDLNKIFKTLDGQKMFVNIIEDAKGSIGGQKVSTKDLTLRDVMTNSLNTDVKQTCIFCGRNGMEEQIPGEEKARRCYLSMEIYKAKTEVELEVSDVDLIRERIGKIYPSLVVGQAWEMIDPKKKKK